MNEIIIFFILLASISPCIASAEFSGTFYNSEYSYSISEECDNTYSAGSIKLLPFEGFDGYPYAILATSEGCSIGGSADAKHSIGISASGNGKTVTAKSTLTEDSKLRGAVSSKWGHEMTLGGECSLHLFTSVSSMPGYLTYPTSSGVDSISAGMTLEAFERTGQLLFDKKYVPSSEFGDFPLVLGVAKSPLYPDVYIENKLDIYADW
jgi:hypothetical protein